MQSMTSKQRYPHLAVTMGDPAGIGAEIILKALRDLSVNARITVVGTTSLLEKNYLHLTKQGINGIANPAELSILDVGLERDIEEQIILGAGNAASGAASFAYLETAIARTLAGEFDGIVTAPIAKSLWKAAGHEYPGQTEVLARRSQTDKFGMLFVARSPHTTYTLRTLLATTHIPLRQVPDALNPELMSRKLDLLVQCLQTDFAIETPTIAISGLNPHSGEAGQLGTEEVDWLISWIESEQKNRPNLKLIGPVPPDTLWVKVGQAWYNPEATNNAYDGYLALYHDQGLIPVKLLAFDYAINTTIGLPFIRTSPDHGTAFDIAGKGIANATSMREAIKLAVDLTTQRIRV
ncbi:MAG: 4-hydroxythreonine-4-phosphate dehydrogenase PdxA [Oscillatoria sp. PMC 1050.18]|nr:4-hydroxythreonine-4-phosphate dehydrogenase PdxA [Oscillatoria sp. PMC 1050.18]